MRRPLIGLVAAGVLLLGACSDDDGGDESGSGPLGGEEPTEQTGSPSGGEEGYTDEGRDAFMNACTTGSTESECLCAWSHITANVPYEEFAAYEEALRQGEAAELPEGISDAQEACM